MAKRSDSLKVTKYKVASPCSESWDDMAGEGGVRHCGSCKQNVYDSSKMSLAEVETLVRGASGACMRLYQRKDGTLLTADCAVGARRRRKKQAAFGLGLGALSALGAALTSHSPAPLTQTGLVHEADDESPSTYVVEASPTPEHGPPAFVEDVDIEMLMGEIAIVEEPPTKVMGKIQRVEAPSES